MDALLTASLRDLAGGAASASPSCASGRRARCAAASVIEQRRRLEPETAPPLIDVVREAIALLT